LVGAPEAAATGTGRFDDLRLAAFAGSRRVAILSLDFILIMGFS
jgi:hypothetical protein